MRTAVELHNHTIRVKMAAYGGYECYSDEVATLLAFESAVAACRFCAEAQQWLMGLPWPAFATPVGRRLCGKEASPAGALFNGLRIAMTVHTGECFLEDSAIPAAGGEGRGHYYGKALSQLLHIAALAQGGQVVVSKPVWELCARQPPELASLAIAELGAFAIPSTNHLGLLETETIELLQVLPAALKARAFKPISAAAAASPTMRIGSAAAASEIEVITHRRKALAESIGLVKTEFHTVEAELRPLMDHARALRKHFHLLSPPEMVNQLNELYAVMERVALRAEEVHADIAHLSLVQGDLEAQSRGLHEVFRQHQSQSKNETLHVEMEMNNFRVQAALQEAEEKHRSEIEGYKQSLAQKEQTIRKLYKVLEQQRTLMLPH
ncbi:unnamed protein product [Phytomonas sp. Hart1]|nr:unnamed protein product [Phytomonas sp. Hart1]|eukprot:CCW69017.1 unnamed protein product [Phytomonas sp. isolate Hart1]